MSKNNGLEQDSVIVRRDTKYRTDEERLKFINDVKALVQKGMRVKEACRQIGGSDVSYYTWQKRLLKGGKSAYTLRTKEEIIDLVNSYQNRGNVTATSWLKVNGLRFGQLSKWIKKYGDHPVDDVREIWEVPATEDTKRLKNENQRLKAIIIELMLDKQALVEYAGRK